MIDVQLKHVADHAVPFAAWLQRQLERHSPWHRERAARVFSERQFRTILQLRRDLTQAEQDLDESELRRKQLLRVLDEMANQPASRFARLLQTPLEATAHEIPIERFHVFCWEAKPIAIRLDEHDVMQLRTAGQARDFLDAIVRKMMPFLEAQAFETTCALVASLSPRAESRTARTSGRDASLRSRLRRA